MSNLLNQFLASIPALIFIAVYYMHEQDVAYLFAATWCIIGAAAARIEEIIKEGKRG